VFQFSISLRRCPLTASWRQLGQARLGLPLSISLEHRVLVEFVQDLTSSFRVALKGKMKYSPLMPLVFATLHFGYGLKTLVGMKRWLLAGKRPSDRVAAYVATTARH